MSQYHTIELSVITRQVAKDGYDTQTVHLIVRDNMPVRLGSGRYAEVVAAASGSDIQTADQFFALKFLKHDRNSRTVSRNARRRFFEELDKTVQFGAERGRFVVYVGCARVKDVPEYAFIEGKKKEGAEEAFERKLRKQLDVITRDNQQAIDGKLDPAFLAEVQGDFFAMKAEEGTLEDLLFDPRPWAHRSILIRTLSTVSMFSRTGTATSA